MSNQHKFCLDCGDRIFGRTDKKFCSDHCRSNFHNKHNSLFMRQMRHINKVLCNNRKILEEQLATRNACILGSRQLAEQGFRFDYFTQTQKSTKGALHFLIYDIGYSYIQENKVKIFRK